MKTYLLCVSAIFALTACSGVSKISNLRLPPVTGIEGKVVSVDGDHFDLQDDSGKITVDIDYKQPVKITVGEKLRVYGNLDEDDLKEFDAYRIVRADGTVLNFVENTSDIGVVLQGF